MVTVTLRRQRVSDAKRFYEIISNPNFVFFTRVASLEAERAWLRLNAEKRKKNLEHNFAILLDGKLVGGCGVKIDPHRPYNGEIGYFVDEAHWGKGIASRGVRLLEKLCWQELGLHRIEIVMNPENAASVKVAERCGYRREGLLREFHKRSDATHEDSWLYAKLKGER